MNCGKKKMKTGGMVGKKMPTRAAPAKPTAMKAGGMVMRGCGAATKGKKFNAG